MQVVIRTYYGTGTKNLFDLLESHKSEIENIMRSVEGFVSYTLARSGKGGFSVTVCRDKRGITKSVKTAKEFIAKNAPNMSAAAMHIFEGSVITHIK